MIFCQDLDFRYPGETFSLKIPELTIKKAEKTAIIGPSGCGKTTLLNLISGTLEAKRGEIRVADCRLSELSNRQRHAFRIQNIGLVQQQFELLDYLTVWENVLLPYRISGALRLTGDDRERAERLMERVSISENKDRFPHQLSQGERQRTAICRGLVTSPNLILADEPTGNLDSENQSKIVTLLLEQADEIDATVVMVTHEPTLLPLFERTINLPEIRAK